MIRMSLQLVTPASLKDLFFFFGGFSLLVVLVFCACLAPFNFSAKGTHNASPSLCEQVEQEQLLQVKSTKRSSTTSSWLSKEKCVHK